MARTLERFDNLVAMFFARAREMGDKPFLWAKKDGAWTATSWAEALLPNVNIKATKATSTICRFISLTPQSCCRKSIRFFGAKGYFFLAIELPGKILFL